MDFYGENEKLLDENTEVVGTLWQEAQDHDRAENLHEALKLYQRLLGFDISESLRFEIYKGIGNTLLKSGDISGAEKSYQNAHKIFPANLSLIVNLGVLEIQKGNYELAKEKFVQVIQIKDSNDLAWVGLALVHRAHADFDLSRACMLRALDENPMNKTALVQYYKWCREDDVCSDLEKVQKFLESDPNDQEILSLLAQYNA